jgi:hypothetical protein
MEALRAFTGRCVTSNAAVLFNLDVGDCYMLSNTKESHIVGVTNGFIPEADAPVFIIAFA